MKEGKNMNNLKEYIKSENLVFPNYDNLNIIDLMETIYSRFGYKIKNNTKNNYLNNIIPNNKHYLFILSDGTGSNLISKLNKNSILKKNLKCT